eukprot:2693693-Prymnesium_polylepis.1
MRAHTMGTSMGAHLHCSAGRRAALSQPSSLGTASKYTREVRRDADCGRAAATDFRATSCSGARRVGWWHAPAHDGPWAGRHVDFRLAGTAGAAPSGVASSSTSGASMLHARVTWHVAR